MKNNSSQFNIVSDKDTRPHPVLPIGRYRLQFVTPTIEKLPKVPGTAWRGALGHALKENVCMMSLTDCTLCPLYQECSYPYLFETRAPQQSSKMRRSNGIPHPYILNAQVEQSKNRNGAAIHTIILTLMGKANEHLAIMLSALEKAGKKGIGKKQCALQLEDVWQETEAGSDQWIQVYTHDSRLTTHPPSLCRTPPVPSQVIVQFQTPMRLQRMGENITPDTFEFSDFFTTVLRRISMLTQFYTETPLETDFQELVASARNVITIAQHLEKGTWRRYSSRQNNAITMYGIVGEIVFSGASLEPYWPYLWLGQWVHAGKGTVMGMGKYRIITNWTDQTTQVLN